MASLTIELPPRKTQTEHNLRRWSELLQDPKVARLEERVETDRFGHIIMSASASAHHASFQCSEAGVMSFYTHGEDQPISSSRLCPEFPRQVQL